MSRPPHTRVAAQRATDLRNKLTVSEARLWGAIKNRQAGARFRRQVPIGHWIADFAAFEPKLVIEVDDMSHEYRDESARTAHFEACGFAVLRFTNRQIAQELAETTGTVTTWVQFLLRHGRPPGEFD